MLMSMLLLMMLLMVMLSQPVQLQGTVALPFFAGAVLSEGQWYLGDDACPPSACQLADPLIACNCYLVLLEHQAD